MAPSINGNGCALGGVEFANVQSKIGDSFRSNEYQMSAVIKETFNRCREIISAVYIGSPNVVWNGYGTYY